jgi:zinc protease
MIRAAAAALALATLVALTPPGAESATAVVDLGGSRAYVRPDPGLTLCGISLFVRAGLDRQTGDQNGLAALVAQSILQTPVDGMPLVDAVAARGGELAVHVSPQYVRFYLEAPGPALPALATLVAGALAAPSFDAALTAARTTLTAQIAADERDPRRVGMQMLLSARYIGGAGMPPRGTPSSLAGFNPADARAFYHQWYLRGDTFVTVVGQTGVASDAASRALVAAIPPGSSGPLPTLATRDFAPLPKRLVTRRDVYVPFVVLGFAAPSLGDTDFGAALVFRTMLSQVLERDSAATQPVLLRPGGTMYTYDTAPAFMSVWLNGGRLDPTEGLSAIDEVLKRAAAQPLQAAIVTRFKERARGEWALEALSLKARTWELGNALALGLDADISSQVDGAIARVTPADLQRVAKRYFQRFDVALVLPREGSGG